MGPDLHAGTLTRFTPGRTRPIITSTANLRGALDFVIQAHSQGGASQIDAWAERGAPTRKVLAVEGGKIVKEEDVAFPENPFEQLAQFGFATYSLALKFSHAHHVPIVADA